MGSLPLGVLSQQLLAGYISFDEYRDRTADQRGSVPERDVPQHRAQPPSARRRAIKARLRQRYTAPALAVWRERAEEAYQADLKRG